MKAVLLRTPFWLTFARCLRLASLPVLLATGGGLVAGRWLLGTATGEAAAPGANTPWLHLPLFTAAIACAMAAAAFWPLFTTGRPGADWITRLQRGPLRGNGAVIAGALAAQFVLTAPVALLLPRLLGTPATAAALVVLPSPADALLNGPGQSLHFVAPAGLTAVAVQLRPLAAPPTGPLRPSRLQILADGQRLVEAAPGQVDDDSTWDASIDQSGQLVQLPCTARPVHELHIVMLTGNVPLVFPDGSVTVVRSDSHSSASNGLLAAVAYLLPAFVALALACLCGARAALPTVLGVIGTLLFVQTLGGSGPADDGLRALLRGHWLPSRMGFSDCLSSLAVGCVAMIAAMLLHRHPLRNPR